MGTTHWWRQVRSEFRCTETSFVSTIIVASRRVIMRGVGVGFYLFIAVSMCAAVVASAASVVAPSPRRAGAQSTTTIVGAPLGTQFVRDIVIDATVGRLMPFGVRDGGGDGDVGRRQSSSCVDDATEWAKTCADETEKCAERFERGDATAEETVSDLTRIGAECAAKMTDIGAECRTAMKECEDAMRGAKKACVDEAKVTEGKCAAGELTPAECVAALTELGQKCAEKVTSDLNECAEKIQTEGEDPEDCEAERRALAKKCHDEYDEIKSEIASGDISFLKGMKKLAELGRDCAKKAMDIDKRCRPPRPPPP